MKNLKAKSIAGAFAVAGTSAVSYHAATATVTTVTPIITATGAEAIAFGTAKATLFGKIAIATAGIALVGVGTYYLYNYLKK